MATFFERITQIRLEETEAPAVISVVFSEFMRKRHGTRTVAQVKAATNLTNPQYNAATTLFDKVMTVAQHGRLSVDVERFVSCMQSVNRDRSGNEFGINGWPALLAEIDAWIATGDYN